MPLPDLMLLEHHGGDWNAYLDAIYAAYMQDIVHDRPQFRGLRVAHRRVPESQGKGAGFWHVISHGKTEDDRIIDIRRCERIRWIRHLIDNEGNDQDITSWENERGRESNVLLWLQEEYLVILGRRSDHYLLRTAYHTVHAHRVEALRKERDAWLNAQQG